MIPAELYEVLGGSEAVEQWIADTAPPSDEVEEFARGILAEHTEWDGLHYLLGFTWDDSKIGTPLIVGINPAVHPTQYPDVLPEVCAKFLSKHGIEHVAEGTPPVVGFVLEFEAFGLTERGEDLTDEQRDALENRKLHTLEESVEQCVVIVALADGRSWWLSKNRADGAEKIYRPGDLDERGGNFQNMMTQLASTTPVVYLAASMVNLDGDLDENSGEDPAEADKAAAEHE